MSNTYSKNTQINRIQLGKKIVMIKDNFKAIFPINLKLF